MQKKKKKGIIATNFFFNGKKVLLGMKFLLMVKNHV